MSPEPLSALGYFAITEVPCGVGEGLCLQYLEQYLAHWSPINIWWVNEGRNTFQILASISSFNLSAILKPFICTAESSRRSDTYLTSVLKKRKEKKRKEKRDF